MCLAAVPSTSRGQAEQVGEEEVEVEVEVVVVAVRLKADIGHIATATLANQLAPGQVCVRLCRALEHGPVSAGYYILAVSTRQQQQQRPMNFYWYKNSPATSYSLWSALLPGPSRSANT